MSLGERGYREMRGSGLIFVSLTTLAACGARSDLASAGNDRAAPRPAADCTPSSFARALGPWGKLHVQGDGRGRVFVWGDGHVLDPSITGEIVAQIDAQGHAVDPLVLDDPAMDALGGIAFGEDASLVVGGHFRGTMTLGSSTLTGPDTGGLFVAKLDSARSVQWAKSIGRSGYSRRGGVAVDRDGNVLVEGLFAGTLGFGDGKAGEPMLASDQGACLETFVAKLDRDGRYLWGKTFAHGGICFDASDPSLIVPSPGGPLGFISDGSAVVAAWGHGGDDQAGVDVNDPFLLELDPDGNLVWQLRYPGLSVEDLALGPTGNVLLSGKATWFDVTIGSITTHARGFEDWLLAEISPAGRPRRAHRFGASNGFTTARTAFDDRGNAWAFAALSRLDGSAPVNVGGFEFPTGTSSFAVVAFDPSWAAQSVTTFGVTSTRSDGHTEAYSRGGIALDDCYDASMLGDGIGALELDSTNVPLTALDGAFLMGRLVTY